MRRTIVQNIQVIITREGDSFLATVPALDLTSFGDTLEEARKNITEAIGLFVDECQAMGTLEEVLQSCGWRKVEQNHESHLEPPRVIASIDIPVSIPA